MLDKEQIKDMNRKGFFPGPQEQAEAFFQRVNKIRERSCSFEGIPRHHLEWVRSYLWDLFGFVPECLPCFYSNRNLRIWQAAACWVEERGVVSVQLREAFRKGRYLGIYRKEEILAHEAVHAARGAFEERRYEEMFAYMTSENRLRRIFGPVVEHPWQVWPFLLLGVFGAFFPLAYLGAAAFAGVGFYRLIQKHRRLQKAFGSLKERGIRAPRAFLLRLTDKEIEQLARGTSVEALFDLSFRWQFLRTCYEEIE